MMVAVDYHLPVEAKAVTKDHISGGPA